MRPSSFIPLLACITLAPVTLAPFALPASAADRPARAGAAADTPASRPTDRVDLNNASAEELDKLPGVGEATARKIISHRPYESVKDLTRAGIGEKLMEKIEPLVYVYRHPLPHGSPAGMVWVNTATNIYHHESDPWYGRSKEGKYMTEEEAKKAGYLESRVYKSGDGGKPKDSGK